MKKNQLRINIDEMITVFIIAMLIRAFIFCPFKIPTGSMEPTLHGDRLYGDKIFVNRYTYFFNEPKRGDIIVFSTRDIKELDWKKKFIKRLVGLPGESLYIDEGHLYVNGKRVEDSEVVRDMRYSFYQYSQMKFGSPENPVIVPEDSYFVLGDNTDNSKDSRYFGFVPKRNLLGKAIFIWWPYKRWGLLH